MPHDLLDHLDIGLVLTESYAENMTQVMRRKTGDACAVRVSESFKTSGGAEEAKIFLETISSNRCDGGKV